MCTHGSFQLCSTSLNNSTRTTNKVSNLVVNVAIKGMILEEGRLFMIIAEVFQIDCVIRSIPCHV
jgi:hypothetical protein